MTGKATLEFTRDRPQEPPAPVSASTATPPQEGRAMTLFMPAYPTLAHGTVAWPEPLPSLSMMLLQNRMAGDHTLGFGKQLATTHAATTDFPAHDSFESLSTLSESELDELFSHAEPRDYYASPDISPVFDSQNKLQDSQDLDLSGREFISSPAIPVFAPFPKAFGEMLVPIRLLDPVHPRPDRSILSRYSLRDKPRAPPALPSFESLRREFRVPFPALRPPVTKTTVPGKSARTRLFRSPDNVDKENQPANVEMSAARAAHALAQLTKPEGNVGKKRIGHAQPLVDSAIRAAKKKRIVHGRHSLDSATPVRAPPPPVSASQSARKSRDCCFPGCNKGARSRGLCKRHGGGKRCSVADCARSDQGGGRCIGHGGGKRCGNPECSNAAQSRGFCKSHGGGKRCAIEGCAKSSQGRGFCRAHGGAKLCKAPVCFNYRHRKGLCRSHYEDRKVKKA